MFEATPAAAVRCAGCGSEVAAGLLACPGCGSLVHAAELKRLASEATDARAPLEALTLWRRVLELLPPDSKQHAAVVTRIDALTREIDTTEAAAYGTKGGGRTGEHEAAAYGTKGGGRTGEHEAAAYGTKGGRRTGEQEAAAREPGEGRPSGEPRRKKGLAAALVAAGALVFKFKSLVLLLATKGKLLLLGLTKGSTFFTMFASFGVYWTLWGWKFAAGFVLSIYVHEMGHVWMLRRFGIAATAPMFIPGLGAMVRLKQPLPTAREDARVGLAGPMWGLAAAFACWVVALTTHSPLFAALTKVGAWVNLFNLLPIWQLDGSRAFRALTRAQRWLACALILAAFGTTREPLLLLILVVAVMRAFENEIALEADSRALGEYAFLIAALSALTLVPARV